MKKAVVFITVFVMLVLLTLGVSAESQFETVDGELTKYIGTDSIVYVPMDVKNIKAGAFDGATEMTCIIFNSFSCTFESGAIPEGVLVKAPESSDAHLAALRDGLSFSVLDGSVNVTVNFQYASGAMAHPSLIEEVNTGDRYSYAVPVIEGFIPNIETVEGTAGDYDITVTVIYRTNENDGWVLRNGRAMYIHEGSCLVSTTEEINGMSYSFDENGYLIMAAGFLSTPNGSYYFSDSVAVTGYRVIGKSIYYFNDDYTMVKGATYNGLEFDISGALIASDTLVTIGNDSYYLIANELVSGLRVIEDKIMYFGSDYKLVKNTVLDGLTFDASGAVTSGINATDLEITGLSDVAYTGKAQEPEVTVKFKGVTLTRDVHYKLYYTNNTAPGEAKLEIRGIGPVLGIASYSFKIIGDEAYTLTIRYVNVMGAPIAESYTTLIEPGEKFSVLSPAVDGYKADQEIVSGTMGSSNITISVTYTRIAETSDTESPDSTTGPLESTTPPPDTTDPAESTDSDSGDNNQSGGYTYDYGLFIKVFVIATIITGVVIVLILNWEDIKKALSKKNNRRK